MFFILSKTLFYLVMPGFLITASILLPYFIKNKLLQKRLRYLAPGLFLLFTNPLLANLLMNLWEIPATPLRQLKSHDVAIVLTGVTNQTVETQDRVHFNRGADRILHPILLYKTKKVRKILISGGPWNFDGKTISEAKQLKSILRLAGIPETDIIVENQARNTRENATFSSQILKARFPNQSYLLITSAFHMRRALGCFNKTGVSPTPFSVDFYGQATSLNWVTSFIPSAEGMGLWRRLTHEVVGFIVYRLVNYL